MRKYLALLVLAALPACGGGSVVRSYAAPAPNEPSANLDCALRTMAGLGYTPVGGGKSDGYIRFARSYQTGMSAMTLRRSTRQDIITVTSAGNQLRLTLVGIDSDGNKQIKASEEAQGHAQAIISGCAQPEATNH